MVKLALKPAGAEKCQEYLIVLFIAYGIVLKKFIHISVSILLLLGTGGVHVNLHYSGTRLYSFSLFGEADSCCAADCQCCHENSINHQVKDDFVLSSASNQISQPVLKLPQVYSETTSEVILSQIISEKERLCLLKIPDPGPDSRSLLQVYLI